MVFFGLSLCVAPGLLLVAYFYMRDAYEAEPVGLIARQFIVGALAYFPIAWMERVLPVHDLVIHGFLVSSLVEESVLFLLIYFTVYHNSEFDEEYDGILYAVALSLGFATLENVFYVFPHDDLMTAAFRAFLPVPGHALFDAVMGFYFGRAKFARTRTMRASCLVRAFLYPWLFHGTYDAALLRGGPYAWIGALIVVLLWINVMRKIRIAQFRSVYRARVVDSDV